MAPLIISGSWVSRSSQVHRFAGFDQILDYIKYLRPKRTLFTHMTALLDQEELLSKCPENVAPGYDGMEINI